MKKKSNLITVHKNKSFKKNVIVPTSKSYANRLLILGALSKNVITIKNLPQSTDVISLINCFKVIGIKYDYDEVKNDIVIHNSFPLCEQVQNNSINLDTKDGGTTNRFLIAMLSLGKNNYIVHPTERMINRPMDDLFNPLRLMNVSIIKNSNSWEIKGPLKPLDQLTVDCSKSTQFASALRMILPQCKFNLMNLNASALYYKITETLLNDCSKGKQFFTVPLDFSSLGYPVALGLTLGETNIENYTEVDKLQADGQLIEITKKMKGSIIDSSSGLQCKQSHLSAIDIKCDLFPDLVPTLIFLCSYARGKSRLYNISILKHKESDRLAEMINLLLLFKVKHNYNKETDCLEIFGYKETLEEKVICKTAKDHRIIMVATLFLLKNSGGEVYFPESVKKSYPTFFEDFL